MKKILYMLLCVLMLVGCTHQTGGNTESSATTTSTTPVVTTTPPKPIITTSTTFQLNDQSPFAIEGIYKNDNNSTTLTINNDGTYEKYCHPSDGSHPWAGTGLIVHITDNIYRTQSDYSRHEGYYPLDTDVPTWMIFDNNTLYQLGICQIMNYFDKEDETPHCISCPDCVTNETHYPTVEELLIFKDYYLKELPELHSKSIYYTEIFDELKKEE